MTARWLVLSSVLLCAAAQAQTKPTLDMASDYGCLACHGLVHKQIGPGFGQVAARYRQDPEAAQRLAAKIQHGSVGVWGRVIMPRQTRVTDADATTLARWVLAQPPQP